MGSMAGQTRYIGDTGAVRKCLAKAGLNDTSFGGLRLMYNDVTKNRSTRRIKLWFADDVFDATGKQQRKLDRALKAEFGTRYLGGHFIATGRPYDSKSFCVKLTAF